MSTVQRSMRLRQPHRDKGSGTHMWKRPLMNMGPLGSCTKSQEHQGPKSLQGAMPGIWAGIDTARTFSHPDLALT